MPYTFHMPRSNDSQTCDHQISIFRVVAIVLITCLKKKHCKKFYIFQQLICNTQNDEVLLTISAKKNLS
jgi:uncharacterized membrane protein